MIGVLCGFCGMALIFLPQLFEQPLPGFYPGYALAVIAAIIWAFYSAKAKNYHYPAAFIAPVMLIFALVSAALHLIFEQTIWPEAEIWLIIFMSGLTRFSYVLWDYGVRHGNAIALSSLAYFTPLFSTLLFLAFGFMPPAANIGLAAIFIILGSLIANADPLLKSISKHTGTQK
jgi:drug/metabolite transporter (DMT)-like permease